jgi:hypothetical protein
MPALASVLTLALAQMRNRCAAVRDAEQALRDLRAAYVQLPLCAAGGTVLAYVVEYENASSLPYFINPLDSRTDCRRGAG